MANPSAPEPALDGRLRRSERSRQAIVEALIELVGKGDLEPTAQQVAERAGVGIRSVFRHFSDMETLFAEMDARLRGQLAPLLSEATPSGGLAERARELVRVRARFFERVAPFRRSAARKRARSRFLRERQAIFSRRLRGELLRWLPELEQAPEELVEALDLATSFESWDRLRSEQRLGPKRTQAVLERTVRALVAELAG